MCVWKNRRYPGFGMDHMHFHVGITNPASAFRTRSIRVGLEPPLHVHDLLDMEFFPIFGASK